MKKHFNLIVITVLYLILHAFSSFSQQTKLNYALVEKLQYKHSSSELISVLIKGNVDKIAQLTEQCGGKVKYSAGNISSIIIPINKISVLENSSAVERIELPCSKLKCMNDTMEIRNNLVAVHNGQAPLPQKYKGNGVVIGIIDTGIDFSHPDFKDSLGKSRIKFLWDQNLPNAPNTPQPYNYGQNWNNQEIDSGLATAHTDAPYFGHGTHVSGVAAGNGLAINKYAGVAPKADIIVVAVDQNDTTGTAIPDAENYIYAKAQLLGEPCVINCSLGDYYGSHDGLDLQAQVMNNMITAQSGRVFVAAAGNAGGNPFHLGYNVTSDSNFTWFYNGGKLFLQMWADTNNFRGVQFAIGADYVNPTYSFRGRTSFSNITPHISTLMLDTLRNNGNRIAIIRSYGELIGSRYAMEFTIYPDSTAYAYRLITKGNGHFDLWNFDVQQVDLNDSTIFNDLTRYKQPDATQTIVSSFQCSPEVITVGNYINRNSYIDYNNNLYQNSDVVQSLSPTSSVGPTRDGRIKPDICSTGDITLAPVVLSLVPLYISNNIAYKLAQGGFHVRDGGTSTASPVVAGVAALYLQRYPNATNTQVRNAIIACPKMDSFTGFSLPNNDWGYGKLDAFTTLTNCLTGINSSKENAITELYNYPNPFSGETTIFYSLNSDKNSELRITDVLGKTIQVIPLENKEGKIIFSNDKLSGGIYYCGLISGGRMVKTCKLVLIN